MPIKDTQKGEQQGAECQPSLAGPTQHWEWDFSCGCSPWAAISPFQGSILSCSQRHRVGNTQDSSEHTSLITNISRIRISNKVLTRLQVSERDLEDQKKVKKELCIKPRNMVLLTQPTTNSRSQQFYHHHHYYHCHHIYACVRTKQNYNGDEVTNLY